MFIELSNNNMFSLQQIKDIYRKKGQHKKPISNRSAHFSPPSASATDFGVQWVLLCPQRWLRLFRPLLAATQLEHEQNYDSQQEQDDGCENSKKGAGLALLLCVAS